ncbi:hypothetical protein Pfo_012161 [Paulownia fortunei]|nr:hypothetical protein Pfo_012161 [Paulownia fortunei]
MEGSEKGLSPSKSTANPKPLSTGSGENNENDSSQDKTIPKFQNHKKIVPKHFMSPTISAASKAAAPRKKILAERNENSSTFDAQNHKTSNLGMKKSPKSSDDSSVKAYDPLTNYLSPRPKYLRFNPNRRHEIFNRLEKEDLNSSFDSQEVNDEVESASSAEEVKDSSFSPPKENVLKTKNEGKNEEADEIINDDYEEEEEEEELEEERGWCFRGVLKLLLTLIACVLSTSYICSMNSPTPSPTQQAIWNLKDGCLMIKKQTLEVISMKMHDAGFLKVEVGDNYGEVEEVEIDEDNNGETEESIEAEIVEDDIENLERRDKELVGNENEDTEDKTDKAAENEGVRAGEFEIKAENFEQLIAAKTDGVNAGSFCLEKEVDSLYPGLNDDNVDKIEAAETEIVGGSEFESETESFGQLIGAKADESEDAGGYGLEMEVEGSNQLQELELSVKSISEEETSKESKGVDDTKSLEELVGSQEKLIDSGHEVNEIGYDNEVETEKVGWNTSALIGVSVVSIILTSLAIIYHSKKAKSTSAEESEPVLKPHKLAVEEKVTPVLPSMERKIEFFARPSLSHSMEEAPGELNHHIRAPTVELIGEIVVGQVSSLNSCGGKYQTESEESNTTFFPKQHGTPPQPVSAPTQPSAVEYSSISSPSYGSFTTERKILKKEGGQSGEAMIEVTPVRRSSRLRNRVAVMSP